MKTYQPRIKVTLVKTARRGSVAPGIEAAKRYQEFEAIDLTPLLAESMPISVHRSISDTTGQWSLMLIDKMMAAYGETVYAMIEPNDVIEIGFAHNAAEYGGKLPVVMRGFVTTVRRRRAIDPGGRPMRTLTVTGHDYGKLLEIMRIYYLDNSVIGDNIIGEFRFFQKYVSDVSQAKIMSAKEFVQLVIDKLINPFIGRFTVNEAGKSVGSAIIHKFRAKATIPGSVNPFDVSAFAGGSTGEFLKSLLDVGAFNEMLIEDTAEGVDLIVRPNHFLGLDGKAIQGEQPEVIEIESSDVVDIEESRTDANVANYYWVNNFQWQLIDNMDVRRLAEASRTEEYALMEYTNTAAARYGFKKMEIGSALGPESLQYKEGATESERITETDMRVEWLAERRRVLALQNRDNVVFESGQMLVRGNERIRRGTYLRLKYESGHSALHYVTAVSHQFVPFGAFTTFVQFERGTAFAERATMATAPYLSEMNLKGAA